MLCESNSKKVYLNILIVTVTLLACLILRLHLVPAYLADPMNSYDDMPLLTTPDGYYYLRYAEDVSAGTYAEAPQLRLSERPAMAPLLSLVTGKLASDNREVRSIAFYLPSVLSLAIVLVIFLFGRELKNISVSTAAALFTALAPIWMLRTAPGYFDTDCLNLFFFWFIIYICWKMISTRKIALWSGILVPIIGVFYLWWPQAALPYSLLAIGCCAPALWLTLRRKWLWLAIVAGGAAVFLVLAYLRILPEFALAKVDSVVQHILFLAGENKSLFRPTAQTVIELVKPSIQMVGKESSGHLLVLGAGVVGLVLLIRRNVLLGLCLALPVLVSGGMAMLFGSRFEMFMVPGIGFGVAWLSYEAYLQLKERFRFAYAVFMLLMLVMLLPSLDYSANYKLGNYYTTTHAARMSLLAERTEPDSMIWTQWGYGYFAQHMARRKTLVDGGIQSPEFVYIMSVPLASSDYLFAANWMKFFAKHNYALIELSRILGGKVNAVEFLKDVLKDERTASEKLKAYKLPEGRNWMSWLFPKNVNVYLYLSNDCLIRSSWLTQGMLDLKTGKESPDAVVYATPTDKLGFNRKTGQLKIGNKIISNSKICYVTPKSLSHDVYGDKGPVSILIKGANSIYTIPKRAFNALAFQLLFVTPGSIPRYKIVIYNPYVGGVWKVE